MPAPDDDPTLDAAIAQAADAEGLATWYRACVRPLVKAPRERWPTCCGGACEPCNELLTRVAARALSLLAPGGP